MIVGEKKWIAELDKLSGVNLETGVKEAISHVQGAAKKLCRVNHGELRESIHVDMEYEGVVCRGVCYTNKSYAPYVEFGTGPNGQASHDGVSPDVPVAYNQKGWMIPGNAMSLRDAEKYGLGVVEGKDGAPIGYLTKGQAARPFLYPALKNNEKEVDQIISEAVRRQL